MSKDTFTEFEFEVFPQFDLMQNENVIYAGTDISKIELAKNGKTVILEKLDVGIYNIAGEIVEFKNCGMLPVHFVSRATGHESVRHFKEDDFKMWYDSSEEMITPILASTFNCQGMIPVLTTGNLNSQGKWSSAMAVGEMRYGKGRIILCQLDLTRRLDNPVAKLFYNELIR